MSERAALLRQDIVALRGKVDALLRKERADKVERIQEADTGLKEGFRPLPASQDVQDVFDALRQLVAHERRRYAVIDENQPPAGDGQDQPPPLQEGTAAKSPPVGLPPAPTTQGAFTATLVQDIRPLWDDVVAGDTPRECFGFLFDHELRALTGEAALLNSVGAHIVPKLRKAAEALKAERLGDATTILKTTLQSDPHNHTLAFIHGQLLYLQAGKGQRNAHAEARDLAQRAMIFSDKIPTEVLTWYQYHSICSEINHSPERALEWLRETGLLKIKHLTGRNGWSAHNGGFLKAWMLLAEIPVELWGEREFAGMADMVWKVVGGAALYMAVFRPLLVEASAARKEPLPFVEEMETALALTHKNYMDIAQPMDALAALGGKAPWTVRARLVKTLAGLAGRPAFDHVLLHVSLNSESWHESVYPDHEVRNALGDNQASTWRWWAMAITPMREQHLPNVLPAAYVLAESDLLADAEKALAQLVTEERERIKPDLWDKLVPWMAKWEMEHLLAAGSGSSKPRSKFIPSTPPFNHFYRKWSAPSPSSILASEIIIENAKRGAFASWYEILAAFEGAWRLIDDPVHGMLAIQNRALAAARQHDPNQFANVSLGVSQLDFSRIGIFLVPLGLLTGVVIAVSMTRNVGQAIGVILVLAGLAGVLAIQMTKKY